MASRKRKQKRRRNLVLTVGLPLMLLILGATLVVGVFFVAGAAQDLPDLTGEHVFTRAETSKIYDTHGELIADLYVEQNRIVVPLEKISTNLQEAVIAIEDQRFYDHEGVDWKAIARALAADVREGKVVQGGSTVTQQFIKNTLITPEQTFDRKIREAILAYQIERQFSKEQILEGYLNTIYFGQSAYGAETASQTFFGKSAQDLTLPEAALLAGVIRSPNNYSPYVDEGRAKARRDLVISTMEKQKVISEAEALEAINAPIEIKPLEQADYPYPYFVDYVKQLVQEEPRLGSTVSDRANALFKGGLRIYTTLDPKLQELADDSVWSVLNRPEDPVGSLVSIEPSTGYIRAMVGGRDWQEQKLNLAVQAVRQPGSAFKPFVLAAAIEQGISVSQSFESGPVTIKLPGNNWQVKNSSGAGGGQMTLRNAMVHSVNAVFARLIMEVGPGKVVELVKKMGIDSPVEALPAIALGGLGHGVTPLEMASAYGVFGNGGLHAKPMAITKITDASGEVVLENQPAPEPALDPVAAYLVTDILKDVIRYGTGRRAGIGRPAAGKTGTTEFYGDAWFVGYTPDLTTSVWVGYRESRQSMTNVHGIAVAGGTFPAQIWQKFMSRALAGRPARDFDKPTEGIVWIKVCTDMPGVVANEFCEEVAWSSFAKGTGPRETCDVHQTASHVAVPNVVGRASADAQAVIEEAGLAVKIKEVDTALVPAGQVVGQTPIEGAEAPRGSEVEIEVSTGRQADATVVPSVVGMAEGRAKNLVGQAGLRFQIIQVDVTNRKQVGKVVGQSPPAGVVAEPDSIVRLRIGR
jgi:penicillin-binding protein 1A